MAKTIIKAIFSMLLILSSVFAQRETVGFEYNQHSRYIDSLKTKSSIWSMSYRNELPSGTRVAASIGLDYMKFFDNDSTTNPILKSTNQVFVKLEGLQKLYFMYFKGAIQFYSVKGNAVETTGGYSEVLHNNIYRIFEFPLGAGITFPIDAFDFYVGLNKVYFYGTNEKEIIVNNGGTETSLGSTPRRTFQSELGLGAEATVLYHLSENLDFELNFTKYEEKDFSVRFSIWGPLKRMLYIN
ncbi:hypothetical protein KKF86_02045 [bacterium]|nr:hypothetical protein [bacterium]